MQPVAEIMVRSSFPTVIFAPLGWGADVAVLSGRIGFGPYIISRIGVLLCAAVMCYFSYVICRLEMHLDGTSMDDGSRYRQDD